MIERLFQKCFGKWLEENHPADRAMMFLCGLVFCGVLILFLLCAGAIFAAEVDDLKRELTVIQLKISEEEARYQAAKAQMERAQIVAQYLFPDLRARERQLVEKIEKLNGQK